MSWYSKQDSKSHTSCAHPHTSLQTTFTPHGCSGVHQHARSHLRARISAVKDHKANTSLTVLDLVKNNVGDAGAAALADALQATVLMCKKCVFWACA